MKKLTLEELSVKCIDDLQQEMNETDKILVRDAFINYNIEQYEIPSNTPKFQPELLKATERFISKLKTRFLVGGNYATN